MTKCFALVQRGIELQTQINRLIHNLGPNDPWLAVELTMPQLKVLFRLNTQGPSKVGALARALRVTLPTMTGILDRLVEQGLIRRDEDPADRRLVISRLTPDGQELVNQLQAAGRSRLARVYETLSPDVLATHVSALEQVLLAAEAISNQEHAESIANEARQ
jgi:DNA-binding MarR family transcriptional regulator